MVDQTGIDPATCAVSGNYALFICLINSATKCEMDVKAGTSMDRRDTELLNKQFHWHDPAPQDAGSIMLVILAIFFIGVALGTFLPYASQ